MLPFALAPFQNILDLVINTIRMQHYPVFVLIFSGFPSASLNPLSNLPLHYPIPTPLNPPNLICGLRIGSRLRVSGGGRVVGGTSEQRLEQDVSRAASSLTPCYLSLEMI